MTTRSHWGTSEHYSDAAPPSRNCLGLQHTLQFAQVKLAFNHGWLVQAEACRGHSSSISSTPSKPTRRFALSDVAFYFVHWLVDLAGAEPTPLKGSEKFVLKFPHAILHSFISSFSIVGSLVSKTETQVFETFLNYKWAEVAKDLGTPPTGPGAIALMRLVTQVQHLPLQQRLVSAWPQLDPDDQKVLAFEMSLTGVSDQSFERVASQMGGPSILVYSPAFMSRPALTLRLACASLRTYIGRRAQCGHFQQQRPIITSPFASTRSRPDASTIMDGYIRKGGC